MYKFAEPTKENKEQAIARIESYAEVAPECGYCEQIIFAGNAVIAGRLQGVTFVSTYVKGTEFVHFACIDSPEAFQGWINKEGQLTSAFDPPIADSPTA